MKFRFDEPWQQRISIGAVVLLIAVSASAFSSAGIARPGASATVETRSADAAWLDDVGLPPGVHRDQFACHCMNCHSARLVLGQPRFTRKKWGEIVHKMNAVYGAPIPAHDEKEIVEYLVAVHGKLK